MTPTKRTVHIALPSTGDEEWQAVREPLATGWLTQGPKVAAFEQVFAARHHVHHALATTSCTTALHLALAALGIGPGDEAIVPAFTWVATANVVLYCGATPVFADVDPATYNIDVADALSRVTGRTRAIIPVHLFGLCADVDTLRAGLPDSAAIVEDAACAAGAEYKGRRAGGLGNAGCFSFHPRKSITTGEGGMLTTNDESLAGRAEMLRNHGASVPEEQRHQTPRPYLLPEFNLLGFNYRPISRGRSVWCNSVNWTPSSRNAPVGRLGTASNWRAWTGFIRRRRPTQGSGRIGRPINWSNLLAYSAGTKSARIVSARPRFGMASAFFRVVVTDAI